MVATPSNNPGALIIDANVAIAICSRETGRDAKASTELSSYATQGYEWFAPGVIVMETLYVLCQKHQAGLLTAIEYDDAVNEFDILMSSISPPPGGDGSLIQRAHAISRGYGCSRSADSIYIALAETLSQVRPTTLITFDTGLPNHVANNSPGVIVHLLTI